MTKQKWMLMASVAILGLFTACIEDEDEPTSTEITITHSSRGAFATDAALAVIGGDARADDYELITYGISGQVISIYAPYFSFNLAGQEGTVTNAILRIYAGKYNSPDALETVQFNEVTTDSEDLKTAADNNMINIDLGDGTVEISAADDDQYVEVTLNAAAIQAINSKMGMGIWSVGGSLLTAATSPDHSINEVFNFNDSPTPPDTELVLVVE